MILLHEQGESEDGKLIYLKNMDTTRMKIVQPDIWLHFSPILAIGMHAILYSSGKGTVEVGNAVVV